MGGAELAAGRGETTDSADIKIGRIQKGVASGNRNFSIQGAIKNKLFFKLFWKQLCTRKLVWHGKLHLHRLI